MMTDSPGPDVKGRAKKRTFTIVSSGTRCSSNWELLVLPEVKICDLFLRNLDPQLVLGTVQTGSYTKAAFVACGAKQVDHGLIAHQRLPFQLRLMNENSRCSTLFHLLVPGG